MVRGKKPLRSGVPKSVISRVDCKCGSHLHLLGIVQCVLSCTRRKTRSSSGGSTCVSARYGSREVHGRRWLQTPRILRNCPTFSAAPRIRVSLNMTRVKFCLGHHEQGRVID
jgi:hypothetical protein